MSTIEDRLDLLEQRYLVTRERMSKLERVQYQLREQIGFIQYLSKDEENQRPIEDRLNEIYLALGQLMEEIDKVSAPQAQQSHQPVQPSHIPPAPTPEFPPINYSPQKQVFLQR
ncbi:MAG: hypothetical protein NE330_10670 [Lentisphaeraceae bacterium]|nr:hypothetical protein [Lentisphaeraceae bacterium]